MATPQLTTTTDHDLMMEGRRQAIIQAHKNAFQSAIRRNPEDFMGPVYASKLMQLMGEDLEEKEVRNSPAFLITFNPAQASHERSIAFFKSFCNHIRKYKWVAAFAYGVELRSETGAPHLHMVLETKKKRYPSEIKAQIWAMAHNHYHMHTYADLFPPGHNVRHLDVRPLSTKRDVKNSMAYIAKGREDGTLIHDHYFRDSLLLWPDREEKTDE